MRDTSHVPIHQRLCRTQDTAAGRQLPPLNVHSCPDTNASMMVKPLASVLSSTSLLDDNSPVRECSELPRRSRPGGASCTAVPRPPDNLSVYEVRRVCLLDYSIVALGMFMGGAQGPQHPTCTTIAKFNCKFHTSIQKFCLRPIEMA
jgi:hypothetical protein